MKIKCGNCGKDILVPDDLVAGQHVRCPYCNEKTAFDKPSRVELPDGFEVKRKARTKIDELKRKYAQESELDSETPDAFCEAKTRKLDALHRATAETTEESRPKLALRRPAQETKDREHMNAAAAAVHERIRKAERKQRIASIKKSFGNIASLLALVVLMAAGYCVWRAVQKKEVPKPVADVVESVVEKVTPGQDDAEGRRRKDGEAQEQKRIEAENARKTREAEMARMDAERKLNAEAYERFAATFCEGCFAMANHAKIAEAVEKRNDAFYFCLADDAAPIYEVTSTSNGTRQVVKLCADGVKSEMPFAGFVQVLEKSDYLMAHGDRAYLRLLRPHPMTGQLDAFKVVDPSERFFGPMYEPVKKLGMACAELSFDIVFQPKGSQKEIVTQTVEFGCGYSLAEVREAVAEAFPMKGAKDSMRIKKFKRTVVFWDGNMIKKDMKGVTYVPKTYQHHGTKADYYGTGWSYGGYGSEKYRRTVEQDRNRWKALRDQAAQEDLEEKRYYEREQRRVDEELAKTNAAAQKKWEKSIDDILKNGTLIYKAKIAKNKEASK